MGIYRGGGVGVYSTKVDGRL